MGGKTVDQAGELRSARIESLRALAALAVLTAHVYLSQSPGDFTHDWGRGLATLGLSGVDVFFVLTGYLLFWPFVRSAAAGRRTDLRRYAVNRALRILPLYYFVTAFLLVLQHDGGTRGQWARFLTFTQNYSATTRNTVDIPMWSLAVEVQFYLLLPFLAAALAWIGRRSMRAAAGALAAIAVASVAIRWATAWHGPPDFGQAHALPGLMFFFAGGMFLAMLRLRMERDPARAPAGLLGRSATWLLAAVLWVLLAWRQRGFELAAAVASFLTVGAVVLPLRGSDRLSLLAWRPLTIVGVASYSVYLWHVPVLKFVSSGVLRQEHTGHLAYPWLLLGTLALSIALSLLTYRLVEAPFLRLRTRWAAGTPPRDAVTAPAAAPATAARSPAHP